MSKFYNLIKEIKNNFIDEKQSKFNKYIDEWKDDIIEYSKEQIKLLAAHGTNSMEVLDITNHFVISRIDISNMMAEDLISNKKGISPLNNSNKKIKIYNSDRYKEYLDVEQKRKLSKWIAEYFRKQGFEISTNKYDACGCSGIEYDYSDKSYYTTYLHRYTINW